MMHRHNVTTLVLVATTLGTAACAAAAPNLRSRSGPYSVDVLVDGERQPVYHHKAQSYVLGRLGHRYSLRVRNRSARRVEAVVTVDGRDVLDGKRGSWTKRGYLIPAHGSVKIDGWRVSQEQVAAFRFSSVDDSYATRTGKGRNVGVIGVALFPERHRRVYVPRPYPDSDWYDSSRQELDDMGESAPSRLGSRAGRTKAPSAGAGQSARAPATKSTPPSAAESSGRSSGALARRSEPRRTHSARRPGLGTAFGERRHSPVREVRFVRANGKRPAAVLGLRYNDRRGLLAMGVDLWQHDRRRREVTLREGADPFPAEHRRYVAPPPGWY